jgi:hypothetical protein
MGLQSKFRAMGRLIGHPAVLGALMRDSRGKHLGCGSDSAHLTAAMTWMCRAQDASGTGGVSIGWYLKEGWQKAYPETTGYIIPTFLEYASRSGDTDYLERALRMGKWELSIQTSSGAICGRPGTGEHPLVFDTGQVIKGWLSLYRQTGEQRWLDAAMRAGSWIISSQELEGSWIRGSHKDIPHAYYTYVAWPLCELSRISGDERFLGSARKHVEWVLSLRDRTGWISRMAFSEQSDPLTHTVAYTYEGLLECARYFGRNERAELLAIVRQAMTVLLDSNRPVEVSPLRTNRCLPAFVQPTWRFKGEFSCLVGNVQFALIWLKLFEEFRDERFFQAAAVQIEGVKAKQDLMTKDTDIRGGVPGAAPFWAGYGSLGYPNWAAKFLADAIMLKTDIGSAKQDLVNSRGEAVANVG